MIRLKEYDESRFWKQIEIYKGNKTSIDDLKASIRKVAENSKHISDLIIKYLPQYTLHNETHILNVLSIMDALVPNEVMKKLTPLECALCIMSAYTHDLGMALTDDEYKNITDENNDTPEHQKFLRFCDGFGEETRQIERWRKKGGDDAERRIELIEGHILASYIRDTHTNEEVNRVEDWLNNIMKITKNESLFHCGNYDFKHDLALIDISHGKSVNWLRNKYKDNDDEDGFCLLVGDENVNLAFPSLLLRLADLMDFDATRTPKILFRHIGIENEKSILEWRKHLSVTGWDMKIREKNPQIRYSARCENPVHHRSVLDFFDVIDQEIKAVREELSTQCRRLDEDDRRYELWLPAEIQRDVHPEGHPHNPKYIYEDIEFRLDQDEIHQLLLGESLWGDPKLCIRELLQNALDALQMRDLRLQIQEKGESPSEPVDRLKNGEELKVTLTWGHDDESGQDYILVKDNGIGMTKEIITKYFTQIGKSFYRSPDFEREKKMMGDKGLLATPISIFGIGILSCFMIGDRLQVRTRPGVANSNDRKAYDITISGPGSLFWLKEGTLDHQGTDVKIFLKKEYKIRHEPEHLIERLKEHFSYKEKDHNRKDEENKHIVDPALIAGSHVVWSLYPVDIISPSDKQIFRIDNENSFHIKNLAPIDKAKLLEKANEWECPERYIGDVEWGIWDWTDDVAGSRIRFWFPQNYKPDNGCTLPIDPPNDIELCRQDELSAFVESQLYKKNRTLIMVKGVYVEYTSICEKVITAANGVGSIVWIDLRGGATPRLTVDRQTAIEPVDEEAWHKEIQDVFVRMSKHIQNEIDKFSETSGALKNVLSAIQWHSSIRPKSTIKKQNRQFNLISVSTPKWDQFGKDLTWYYMCFIQELSVGNIFDNTIALDPNLVRDIAFGFPSASDRNLACNCNLDLARKFNLAIAGDRISSDLVSNLDLARDLDCFYPLFRQCLYSSILQEAFNPYLSSSFPMLNCFHLKGKIGDNMIVGPGLVEFDLESDGTVHPVDLQGERPAEIVQYGYDLVFPMTAIPLGKLRLQCPKWRSYRRLGTLGVLPFLFLGNEDVWIKHSERFLDSFKVDRIFALMPDVEYWSKPFSEWSDDDWSNCGLSALWDIKLGCVLWAKGAHKADDMYEIGKPIKEFLSHST